jgi:hypothetical protein
MLVEENLDVLEVGFGDVGQRLEVDLLLFEGLGVVAEPLSLQPIANFAHRLSPHKNTLTQRHVAVARRGFADCRGVCSGC